jgi:hypothetical protein
MNLLEIRNMIGSIVDYDPQVDSYKSEVNRIVNEVVDDFTNMHPWQWSQVDHDVYTVPDVNLGTVGLTVSSNETINWIANTANLLTYVHEGSIMTITNAADVRDNGEYIIDKVEFDSSTNRTYVSKLAKAPNKIAGWHAATNTALATVLQRYLKLPLECNEPLSAGVRNVAETGSSGWRHFYEITKRADEELNLRLDIVGYPTEWIPYTHMPEKVLTVADFPAFASDLTITSAVTGVGQPWPQGTYEFKFSYVWRGVEGPLSNAVEFTVPAANHNVTFGTRNTALAGLHGLRKKIYVRLKSVGGYSDAHFRDLSATILPDNNIPVMSGTLGCRNIPFFIIDDITTSLAYPHTVGAVAPTISYLKSLPRAPDNNGHIWMIRLHPHPSGSTFSIPAIPAEGEFPGRSATNGFLGLPIRIRYNRRTFDLANDIDTPQMPPDTHRYLVYAAASELFMKHKEEGQAVYYKRKADEELSGCRKRWLTSRAGPYVKADFKVGPVYGPAFRQLTWKP